MLHYPFLSSSSQRNQRGTLLKNEWHNVALYHVDKFDYIATNTIKKEEQLCM